MERVWIFRGPFWAVRPKANKQDVGRRLFIPQVRDCEEVIEYFISPSTQTAFLVSHAAFISHYEDRWEGNVVVWHLWLIDLRCRITDWLLWGFYAFFHQKLHLIICIALGQLSSISQDQCLLSLPGVRCQNAPARTLPHAVKSHVSLGI